MMGWFAKRRMQTEQSRKLYEVIVAQARQPALYADLGVPDTINGRFEMVVLHMFRGPSAATYGRCRFRASF